MNDVPPPFPPLVQQHLWLLVGLFWLVATRVLPMGTRRPGADAAKARALLRPFGLAVLLVCTLLWALQRSIGADVVPFIHAWPSPQKWLGLGVAVLAWCGAAGWVLLRGGARRIGEAFAIDERWVRVLVIVLPAVSAVAAAAAFLLDAPPA